MKKTYFKKIIFVFIVFFMLYGNFEYVVFADEETIEEENESIENIYENQNNDFRSMPIDFYTGEKSNHIRKPNKLSGVTEEMCTSDYWKDKTIIDYKKELMNKDQIIQTNNEIVQGSGTMVFDIENLVKSFNADNQRIRLSEEEIPTRALYINGVQIDNQVYFSKLKDAILNTGYTGNQISQMGICTGRVDIKNWPIEDAIGYSANDPDDEAELSAMNLNEPFVIFAKCEVNGELFYWGYSNNCPGWVSAKNIAICDTKEEWTNYWKVNVKENNFVVIVGSKIILKKDTFDDIQIMLGTIIKLVPDAEIPDELLSEKDDNYIVYFAGKNEDGKAEKKYAILNKNLELNQGFLKLNQKNLLDIAFSCIGDEYGWGGMNGNMDCSLYTRYIYRCFGFELPRNTTWQVAVPKKVHDISNMTDEEKSKYISTLPAGALLYFDGHTMMFIGVDNNKNFIISDLGSAADEDGANVETVYAVNVNSLNVKRRNGTTWLNNLNKVVVYANDIDINDCDISLSNKEFIYNGIEKKPIITVNYNGVEIYQGINYEIEYIDNIEIGTGKVKIKGLNNFTGSATKNFEIKKEVSKDNDDEKEKEDESNQLIELQDDTNILNSIINKNNKNVPKTGDSITSYVALMVFSIIGIISISMIIRK